MEKFEITVGDLVYTVSPGDLNDDIFLITSADMLYALQQDENEEWISLDPITKTRIDEGYNELMNAIGMQIESYYFYKYE